MPTRPVRTSQRPAPLRRYAKISPYRFRKLLEHFVLDASTTDTARATRLSVNSVHTTFRQLRVFFFEVGLFQDFYAGQDPETYQSDNPMFERDLLEFHLSRVSEKRGLKSPVDEPPYHFAESCWRYDFKVLMDQRSSSDVRAMMLAHLLELLRLCGPLGGTPRNLESGGRAIMRQADQRILWLSRNAPDFRDPSVRAGLAEAYSIQDVPADGSG